MSFFRFFFLPSGNPWYEGAIWGNVFQGLLFLLPGFLVVLSHQAANHRDQLEQRNIQHTEQMDKLDAIHKSVKEK